MLRRILRRAARFGRNLGLHDPFMFRLVDTLVRTMSHVFPEIKEQQEHIERVIKGEEEGFNQTLDRGLEIFEEAERRAANLKVKVISGDDAFKLYDTFGFPLDLTTLLASEKGMVIDDKRFQTLMEDQRKRSRSAGRAAITEVAGASEELSDKILNARFDYDSYELELHSIDELWFNRVRTADKPEADYFLVNKPTTPFYAESGGQLGDTGKVSVGGSDVDIVDTRKEAGFIAHYVKDFAALANILNILTTTGKAKIEVDKPRRFSIMRNHTATHLVHAALRKVLGTHVHQAGSLVGPQYLRFDFAHFSKVNDGELAEIENIVNEKIAEKIELQHWRNIPFDEAQKMGALMFFGDKYGDKVNVVQFGDFSKEFCGGTHVKNTADIGFFKIRSESSSASGVRRLEAITHNYAAEYLKIQNKTYRERIEHGYLLIDEIQSLQKDLLRLSRGASPLSKEETLNFDIGLRKLEQIPEEAAGFAAAKLSQEFSELRGRFQKLEDYILMLAERKKAFEKELAKYVLQSASSDMDALIVNAAALDGFKLVSSRVTASDMEMLKSVGDSLRSKLGSGVGLLASVIDGKVALVCVVTDDLIKTRHLQAGKIVGAVAKIVGGGGGGKPHLATAGGKDLSKLDEALRGTAAIVEGMTEQVKG